MKQILIPVSILALLSVAFCLSPGIGVPKVQAVGATQETSLVYTTPDGFLLGSAVPGAGATLVRNTNGITTNVHTMVSSGPGAYSVWWVVVNDPENCVTYLCTFDEPDIVVNATGNIVPNGIANFGGHLRPGGPYSGDIVYSGPDGQLTNPESALIVLVIRYHGPAVPENIPDQISNFFGGCPGGGAPCLDEQLAVFPGPDCTGTCADPNALP